MKRNTLSFLALASLVVIMTMFFSCKKDDNYYGYKEKIPKREWLTGTWKQKDIQFAVPIGKDAIGKGSPAIPTGYSLIDLAPLLGLGISPEIGQLVQFTQLNTFTLNADGTYAMDNPISKSAISFVFPKSGVSGKWALTVHKAVLQFTSQHGDTIPTFITGLTENTLSLGFTLHLAGNDVPMNLILEKQIKEPDHQQQLQWLKGKWIQKDLQFGVTIPADAITSGSPEIPEGTSLIDMAPLLALGGLVPSQLASQIQFTLLNTFNFNSDNTYSFDNSLSNSLVSFLLPDAGTSGKWSLVGDSASLVLQTTPNGGNPSLVWVNNLTENTLSVLIYLDIPNVATIPMNLILEKSSGTADLQQKKQWLTGAWEQQDLQFAVTIPKDAITTGSPEIPAGTSLPGLVSQTPALAQLLGPTAVLGIKAMASSVYAFNTDATYSFVNPIAGAAVIEALFPVAKESGHWGLIGGTNVVLPLVPTGSSNPDLHWVNDLTENTTSLRVALDVGGTSIPMNLLLKKTDVDAQQRAQWLPGLWKQDDLQLAVDIPANALFPGQPALSSGTSLITLVSNPQVAAALGNQAVMAIQATTLSTYNFTSDDTYSFANPASAAVIAILFPNAGVSGNWSIINFGTMLQLNNGGSKDNHLIKDMTSTKVTLGGSLEIAPGTSIPVNIILKKQ